MNTTRPAHSPSLRLVVLASTAVFCVFASVAAADFWSGISHLPERGAIPDEATAARVAEVVAAAAFGSAILAQRPFRAELVGQEWRVSGTLEQRHVGGVAHIRIDRKTGAILGMGHSQ